MQAVSRRRFQNAEAVDDAAQRADRRRFREIAGGTGDLAEAKSPMHGLNENLIVENEIVRATVAICSPGVSAKWTPPGFTAKATYGPFLPPVIRSSDFVRPTTLLAQFPKATSNESYDVYLLK